MTISADTRLLVLLEFLFNRHNLWIGSLFVVFMACRACCDRNVGRKSTHRAGPRNVDVAGRALHYVLTFSTLVIKFC